MAISDLAHSVVARKGPLFFVNHLVLGPIAIWLAIEIVLAHGFHRSPQFVARVIALSCVAIFGYLSLVLGRPGNARLLPCFLATGLVVEVLMRDSSYRWGGDRSRPSGATRPGSAHCRRAIAGDGCRTRVQLS